MNKPKMVSAVLPNANLLAMVKSRHSVRPRGSSGFETFEVQQLANKVSGRYVYSSGMIRVGVLRNCCATPTP